MLDRDQQAASRNPGVLRGREAVLHLGLIGAVVTAVVVGFVYLGGWLTPRELSNGKFLRAFETAGGLHPGFRRNHAKGLCASGYFDSSGNGAEICRAAIFQPGRCEAVGRFSLAGEMPFQADNPGQVRGLGLQLTTSNGQIWRTAMINLPVFDVNTPQGFYDRLLAGQPDPATGKPDPAKMRAFLAAHPETAAARAIIQRHLPSSAFSDSEYRGLNAFFLTNAQGNSVPVRWIMEPESAAAPSGRESTPTTQAASHESRNYLFDDLIAQVHQHPLRWHLILTVGQSGDPTNDATLPWPDSRRRIDAGTLTIDSVQAEDSSTTALLNFDPLVLPDGIAPSDDPLLSARSSVYSASFTARSGESKPPSAITPADVDRTK